MTSKFENLLALVVNENHEEASALFHEIVVEKSREIYEKLIAEEMEMDGDHEEEEVEESMSCDMDEADEFGGDATDKFVDDVMDHDVDADTDGAEHGDLEAELHGGEHEESSEGGDTPATKDDIMDLEDSIKELQAEFSKLMDMEDEEHSAMGLTGSDDDKKPEFGKSEKTEPKTESRRVREYVEKVKAPSNSEDGAVNKKSTVSSAKGRPSSDAKASNIAQGSAEEKGKAAPKAKDMGMKWENVPGGDAGKAYSKATTPKKTEDGKVNTKSVESGSKK